MNARGKISQLRRTHRQIGKDLESMCKLVEKLLDELTFAEGKCLGYEIKVAELETEIKYLRGPRLSPNVPFDMASSIFGDVVTTRVRRIRLWFDNANLTMMGLVTAGSIANLSKKIRRDIDVSNAREITSAMKAVNLSFA